MIKAIIFDMGGVMLQNKMTNVKDNRQTFMDGTYDSHFNLTVSSAEIVAN